MRDVKYYNGVWYRIRRYITRKKFKFLLSRDKIIKVDSRHRGVGKTYMMIERAIKHDISIVVGDYQSLDYIKRFGNPVHIVTPAGVHGERFPNGVMVDESLRDGDMDEIIRKGINIRGGFVANYGGDKNRG